jgi:hypothetical protein
MANILREKSVSGRESDDNNAPASFKGGWFFHCYHRGERKPHLPGTSLSETVDFFSGSDQ